MFLECLAYLDSLEYGVCLVESVMKIGREGRGEMCSRM